jgi:TRAP-type C4-dicarboxylate transport system permease small subunit
LLLLVVSGFPGAWKRLFRGKGFQMAVLRWLDRNFEYALLAALLAALTAFSFLNVMLRYGFNSSIVWSDEVCRYSLVLSGFFSIPCWLRHKTGLRVDAFLPLFPEKLRGVFDWGASLLMLALFSYLTYGIWLVTTHSLRINLLSPTLRSRLHTSMAPSRWPSSCPVRACFRPWRSRSGGARPSKDGANDEHVAVLSGYGDTPGCRPPGRRRVRNNGHPAQVAQPGLRL